ncbi:MAG: nucleotidyltransferase domain-containing protein [Defluviitaleaceae bacterium]|nr:nucleotidyltransferase domain-containing protein [Defluviitaleaceae bacterium]
MTIEMIKEKIKPIALQYGVSRLALFGSVATGESNENSDIDILIEKGELTNPLSFCEFCDALEEAFDRAVDVITYNSIQNSQLKLNILAGKVVIYER